MGVLVILVLLAFSLHLAVIHSVTMLASLFHGWKQSAK